MTPREDTRLQHAQLLLQQIHALGYTPEELAVLERSGTLATAPTVKSYVDRVRRLYRNDGTAATYETGWRTLERVHGHRPVDQITATQLERLLEAVRTRARRREEARVRRRAKQGRAQNRGHADGAVANAIAAFKTVFSRAAHDGMLPKGDPTARLKAPGRRPNRRRALTAAEVDEVYEVATSTGDDPLLDALLLRTTVETGARRDGLVNLRLRDLNARRQTVMLREKNGKVREQPLTLELLEALTEFAHSRGSCEPEDPVFRYRERAGHCAPLTERRFDALFQRVQRRLRWADDEGVTLHWLRHTAGTRIERVAGRAVAREFLGHATADTTDVYTTACAPEVARAWSHVMGCSHPLADQEAL